MVKGNTIELDPGSMTSQARKIAILNKHLISPLKSKSEAYSMNVIYGLAVTFTIVPLDVKIYPFVITNPKFKFTDS